MATFSEVINSEKPVLVDFFTEWFGPCKVMKPVLEELKEKIGDTATIIKVDVEKNARAGAAYGICKVPTLMLFKQGKILWRQSGVLEVSQLETIIHYYV